MEEHVDFLPLLSFIHNEEERKERIEELLFNFLSPSSVVEPFLESLQRLFPSFFKPLQRLFPFTLLLLHLLLLALQQRNNLLLLLLLLLCVHRVRLCLKERKKPTCKNQRGRKRTKNHSGVPTVMVHGLTSKGDPVTGTLT